MGRGIPMEMGFRGNPMGMGIALGLLMGIGITSGHMNDTCKIKSFFS